MATTAGSANIYKVTDAALYATWLREAAAVEITGRRGGHLPHAQPRGPPVTDHIERYMTLTAQRGDLQARAMEADVAMSAATRS